jgi:YD repeat-containing protein
MDLIGYLRRLMNKDTAETFDPATDSLEAIRDWLALGAGAMLSLLPQGSSVFEDWQTEAIDLLIWTPTHPVTNPLIVVTDVVPYLGMHVVRFDVEDAEFGLLQGRANINRWRVMPRLISDHFMLKKFIMEFELYHNDVAHIDQALSFFGLVADPAAYQRTSPDIVGFRYDGADRLMSITDDAGGEVSIGIIDVIEDTWNKFKIEVIEGEIKFYVNEVLKTTHPAPWGLPDRLMYPSWYFESAGGGADTFETYLGAVRLGYEVVLP